MTGELQDERVRATLRRASTRKSDAWPSPGAAQPPVRSKKQKRLIGRSVVHGQHSGAGGVPVLFWGDCHHRGSAQRGRYGLGAQPHSKPLSAAGKRLLHRIDAHAARSGDLLRAVFHPPLRAAAWTLLESRFTRMCLRGSGVAATSCSAMCRERRQSGERPPPVAQGSPPAAPALWSRRVPSARHNRLLPARSWCWVPTVVRRSAKTALALRSSPPPNRNKPQRALSFSLFAVSGASPKNFL
jgi:hypothetical protein